MPDPIAAALQPNRRVIVQLASRQVVNGRVIHAGGGWAQLATDDGDLLVNLAQVALIGLDEGSALPAIAGGDGSAKPMRKDVAVKVGSKAPGRPWRDEDLKTLADAFLDNVQDADLAERHHRTRGQIRELRQGFECARGNVVEDDISEVARTWIARWRRVLAG